MKRKPMILAGLAACLSLTSSAQLNNPNGSGFDSQGTVNARANQYQEFQLNVRYFSILDGTPKLFQLHHDTRKGSDKPIDVYLLVFEMQVMNSDGNPEPEGLQLYNYFTVKRQDRRTVTDNARDCKIWYHAVKASAPEDDGGTKVYPYIEFITKKGARTLETNEDGTVYFSDDIQCWKSGDRFPPS